MRNHFCSKIKSFFTTNPYTDDRLNDTMIYAYDDKLQERTFFTANADYQGKSLNISNRNNNELIHICIDGGIIAYGLEDYVGDGIPRGRCDCMIFNDHKLLLVEFKMDVEPLTKDKTLWKNFSHAMQQISDFYLHFKSTFSQNGENLHDFYAETSIIPIICMKYIPTIHPKRNAQRNNEKEKFRVKTHLKIESHTEYNF